jgi:hypothetical protein
VIFKGNGTFECLTSTTTIEEGAKSKNKSVITISPTENLEKKIKEKKMVLVRNVK